MEFEEQSDRAMMRMLPQAEKDAIQQQVACSPELFVYSDQLFVIMSQYII